MYIHDHGGQRAFWRLGLLILLRCMSGDGT